MSSDAYEYSNGRIVENSFRKFKQNTCHIFCRFINWTDHGAIPVAGANGLNGGKGIPQNGHGVHGRRRQHTK